MEDFTKSQANVWVAQELAKITTLEKAKEHVENFEKSKVFFNSEAGIASGKRTPNARKARFDLAAAIAKKFAI